METQKETQQDLRGVIYTAQEIEKENNAYNNKQADEDLTFLLIHKPKAERVALQIQNLLRELLE